MERSFKKSPALRGSFKLIKSDNLCQPQLFNDDLLGLDLVTLDELEHIDAGFGVDADVLTAVDVVAADDAAEDIDDVEDGIAVVVDDEVAVVIEGELVNVLFLD